MRLRRGVEQALGVEPGLVEHVQELVVHGGPQVLEPVRGERIAAVPTVGGGGARIDVDEAAHRFGPIPLRLHLLWRGRRLGVDADRRHHGVPAVALRVGAHVHAGDEKPRWPGGVGRTLEDEHPVGEELPRPRGVEGFWRVGGCVWESHLKTLKGGLPLCQKLLSDARLPGLLLNFDVDMAEGLRTAGCQLCGARLDSARYPRKPRGALGPLPPEYECRLSFCCAREGCRKRHTPPSVRFLGRRVYLGAVVVLATAMQQGVTAVRAHRLRELLGVSLRTLARWREWWLTVFAESAFWKTAKARFAVPVDTNELPLSLLQRFGADEPAPVGLLRFIAPLSAPVAYLPDRRF